MEKSLSSLRIRPLPDDLTRPFWEATRLHKLSIQRCQACGRVNHPPQIVCGWCSSPDLSFEEVPGTGRLYSYTSAPHRGVAAGATAEYINIVVELDVQEGILMVARVPGGVPSWLKIGQPLHVRFETLDDSDVVLPQFDPS